MLWIIKHFFFCFCLFVLNQGLYFLTSFIFSICMKLIAIVRCDEMRRWRILKHFWFNQDKSDVIKSTWFEFHYNIHNNDLVHGPNKLHLFRGNPANFLPHVYIRNECWSLQLNFRLCCNISDEIKCILSCQFIFIIVCRSWSSHMLLKCLTSKENLHLLINWIFRHHFFVHNQVL